LAEDVEGGAADVGVRVVEEIVTDEAVQGVVLGVPVDGLLEVSVGVGFDEVAEGFGDGRVVGEGVVDGGDGGVNVFFVDGEP